MILGLQHGKAGIPGTPFQPTGGPTSLATTHLDNRVTCPVKGSSKVMSLPIRLKEFTLAPSYQATIVLVKWTLSPL